MSLVDLLKLCDTYTPEIYIYEEFYLKPFFTKGSYELLVEKDFSEFFIYDVVSIRCITSLSIIVVVRRVHNDNDFLPFE